jgi:pimeloyl-ACP methyl ester carboxylesterase
VAPRIRFAQNGDVLIAFQVIGEGPTDLVYLSTFSNLDLIWDNARYASLLNELASMCRVIVMDRRGQGVSARLSPADVPLLEDNVDDVIAVLDAAGVDRAVLMGNSDLGALCTMLAAAYPERAGGLVLFGTTAVGVRSAEYPWQWSEEEWSEYLDDVGSGWGTRAFAERYLPIFCPSLRGDREMLAWFDKLLRGTASRNVQWAIENVMRQLDVRALLPTITAPTLIMHRADDLIEDIGASRDLATQIRGAELVELSGGDHFPWAGDQQAVLRELQRFLQSVVERHVEVGNRVLASVMFTDIVDSTAHAATVGDRQWRVTREAHDRIIRSNLVRFRGREIKTIGDGFLATFDGPARGVQCAREICASVKSLGVDVRVGLHTGEIELDGDDVSGIAVAIGARVGALAGPGEVLVSSTVKDLVVGSGIAFEPRGEHALKGVPDIWRLYAAIGDQIRSLTLSNDPAASRAAAAAR